MLERGGGSLASRLRWRLGGRERGGEDTRGRIMGERGMGRRDCHVSLGKECPGSAEGLGAVPGNVALLEALEAPGLISPIRAHSRLQACRADILEMGAASTSEAADGGRGAGRVRRGGRRSRRTRGRDSGRELGGKRFSSRFRGGLEGRNEPFRSR
jgi:hypothetical protein